MSGDYKSMDRDPHDHDVPLRHLEHQEIEVGCSYGKFLAEIAGEKPNTLFLGIDVNYLSCIKAKELVSQKSLLNVKIVNAEAHAYIRNHIPDDSISAVHIYFPTPYPDSLARQHPLARSVTHRLVNGGFALQLHRILKLGATLRIVTDHAKYYNSILSYCSGVGLEPVYWTSPLNHDGPRVLVNSGCEKKYRNERRSVYFSQFVKI